MKPICLIPAIALASLCTSHAANTLVLFSTGFESDTVGGNPAGFSSNEPTDTNIAVSSSTASTGSNSLFMADNLNGGNPSLGKDFGANYATSTVSFDFLSTLGSNSFRIDYFNTGSGTKNFDLLLGGSTAGTIGIRKPSGAFLVSTGGPGGTFDSSVWNTISLEVDEFAGTANVFLNSTLIHNFTDPSINWTLGKVQINMGYGAITGIEGNIDNVSFAVPEPSSALLLSFALGTLAIRRKR